MTEKQRQKHEEDNRRLTRLRGDVALCTECLHPKIRHVPDGTGATCMVCAWLDEQIRKGAPIIGSGFGGTKSGKICTVRFEFKLTEAEREQAEKADKGSFERWTMCGVCYYTWEQHSGFLCPSGDSTFVPLLDSKQPFLHTKEN